MTEISSPSSTSSSTLPILRVFMTENYFSVTDKLLERLKARFSNHIDIQVEYNIKKVETCDLIIGDRHGIPYKVLRAAPPRSNPPLINFFEGAGRLTLKVSMAKLLKDHPAAQSFCPKTFIITPKELNNTNNDEDNDDQQQQQQQKENSAAPKRRSALPSKAERMALIAQKKQQQDAAAETGGSTQQDNCPFCVLAKVSDSSLPDGGDQRDELAEEMKKNPETVWIAKPTAGSKGVGIFLSRDLNEIIEHVETFNPSTAESHDQVYGGSATNSEQQPQQSVVKKSSRSKFVVQKYIDKPLLVQGRRKFDVRVWCALASPTFEVFVFSEGSCRTASVPYSGTSNLKNPFEHVTNHDIQQYAPGYGENEPGNEMWYDALSEFLQENYAHRVDELREKHGKLLEEMKKNYKQTNPFTNKSNSINIFEEFIRPQFHHVIIQCFLAAKSILELDKFERFQAFQIYGFDMMLDDDLNIHLLEANSAPGFAQCLLEPGVDGAIEEIIAPRVRAIGRGVKMEGGSDDAGKREGRKGYWERVY